MPSLLNFWVPQAVFGANLGEMKEDLSYEVVERLTCTSKRLQICIGLFIIQRSSDRNQRWCHVEFADEVARLRMTLCGYYPVQYN